MRPVIYVAVEGLKGSGKSTVVDELESRLTTRGLRIHLLAPTRALSHDHPLERLALRHGEEDDGLMEALYAARANRHALAAESRRVDVILGDRSIYTSISTRWHLRDRMHPHAHILRVRRREPLLRYPDHVLFLQVPLDVAVRRTRHRHERRYGKRDEAPARLRDALDGYVSGRALCTAGRSGAYASWHDVDATRGRTQVADAAEQKVLAILAGR